MVDTQAVSLEVKPLITSETDPILVDFLPASVLPLPGRLGMTYAPGKCAVGMRAIWQRDLALDLTRIREIYRADVLTTLLEEPEMGYLKIPDLRAIAQDKGMQSVWFPIQDFGAPRSIPELGELVTLLLSAVEQEKTVVIHCRAGLGRTGLVTASCLVQLGYSPHDAFAQVRAVRPGSVETPAQEAFVQAFSERIKR
jgi:Cyclin-dependent kinase inhibitor 3 (CDKN3)